MLNNKASMVCKHHLIGNLKTSAWYLAIYITVVIVLTVLLTFLHEPDSNYFFHYDTFIMSTKIFLLVVGIVTYSAYVKEFIYQGVTRKDFSMGTTLSAILLALVFTVLVLLLEGAIVIYNGASGFSLAGFLSIPLPAFISFFLYYMSGWFMGIVFYGYGLIKGILAILVSVIIVNLIEFIFSTSSGNINSTGWYVEALNGSEMMPYAVAILLVIIIAVAVAYVNYLLNRNIEVKIDTAGE